MSEMLRETWAEANQRGLMAALDGVRWALERHARAADALEETSPEPAGPPLEAYALDCLCEAFGLSPFERSVLLLCAGMELESSFGACCGAATGDPRSTYPTFSLALAALPGAHWSALSPSAPLRRWRLIEVGAGDLLTESPLRIDERVLHYLAGVSHVDERLQGLVDPVEIPEMLAPSQAEVARRIVALWTSSRQRAEWLTIQLVGEASGAKRAVAASACATMGLGLYALRAGDVSPGADERETFSRLWGREAVLSGSALLLEAEELEGPERPRVLALLERIPGLVLVAVREPLGGFCGPESRLDVRRPYVDEQRKVWEDLLGPWSLRLNGQVDSLVGNFSLGADSIRSACVQAIGEVSSGATPEEELGDLLWSVCRHHARGHLDELAQRLEPSAGWEDLVLPEPQRQLLAEIAGQVRQRSRVYDAWGFGGASVKGLGISALFAGPSGTGKTMAAEVLASELRLDLYRIDLSQVVSKYIGETEKNLRRVFDAAEGGGAILLFDEADALFGKRSEVKDSHDRYANIEVSYLLQRMEAYRGLAILTTNLKNALDPAFLRRLRFVVSFAFPDAAQREEIWGKVFPSRTPTEELDPARLARLNVAGGNIRNIALHAAFLAANAGEPVRMSHILTAARSEYAKLEKTLTETEIGAWA